MTCQQSRELQHGDTVRHMGSVGTIDGLVPQSSGCFFTILWDDETVSYCHTSEPETYAHIELVGRPRENKGTV